MTIKILTGRELFSLSLFDLMVLYEIIRAWLGGRETGRLFLGFECRIHGCVGHMDAVGDPEPLLDVHKGERARLPEFL